MTTPAPIDERTAWTAVLGRDAREDGQFVYAVATTGVFCRPSCPSRRPLRRHVRFFATPQAALDAGYRACARCGGAPAPVSRPLERAVAYIERHLDERITLTVLARAAGLSAFHLQRTFVRAFGASPLQYQRALRLGRFKARVRQGDGVGAATYAAGFGSSRGLYESAQAGLGMTPGTYRRGGRGERIRYALATCALGRVLVAEARGGVCAVHLGGDDAALEVELEREFPLASRERDEEALRERVEQVLAALHGDRAVPLPLDLRGTAFQLRVWRALREIPFGETRTYGEVARSIGSPQASRAVARACAANRVAIVVPCHRVVRGDGEAGGYRWGAMRKQGLLELEGRAQGPGGPGGREGRRTPGRGSRGLQTAP
jgi:AraC family transcriptional regulator of adaptative response/methylated-DNA-[protein]-cysteine methyltransferase